MLRSRYVRKTYYVSSEDEQAILSIKDKYGLSTDSDAVRLALRLVAASPVHLVKRKGKPG